MSDTVRVKVKATGIIRTITRANYLLSQSKYEILEEEAPAPKDPPQEKEKAVAPAADEQPVEETSEPEEPVEVTEKPKRGRKKQSNPEA